MLFPGRISQTRVDVLLSTKNLPGVGRLNVALAFMPALLAQSPMDAKHIKTIVKSSLVAVLLAILFVALLAQRLFHPR